MSKIIASNNFIDGLHDAYCPACNGRNSKCFFKCGFDHSHTKDKAINLLWRRFTDKILPRAEEVDLCPEDVFRILRTDVGKLTPRDKALKDEFEMIFLELTKNNNL